MGYAGLLCSCVGALAVLLVASGLLRLAVTFTNKLLGQRKSKARPEPRASGGIPEWDWDDWDDEPLEPVRPWRVEGAIPEPGTLKCMAVLFLTAFVFGFGFLMTGFAVQEIGFRMHREDTRLAVIVLNLPVAALALALLLAWTLPTNVWRGGLVVFVFGGTIFGFVLLVGAIVFGVATVFR